MSKLIKCRSCGKDISKSAANCPFCGAQNNLGPEIKCKDCGFRGKALVLENERSAVVLFVLLVLGLIPGLIYMFFVPAKRICPNCGSARVKTIIPGVGCLIWTIAITGLLLYLTNSCFDGELQKLTKNPTPAAKVQK